MVCVYVLPHMLKKLLRIFLVILFIAGCAFAYLIYQYPFLSPFYRNKYSAAAYRSEVTAVQAERQNIPSAERKEWLTNSFDERLADYWLGTRWDFNGTTETPGKGKIACGYFVTTVVRDMGFKINRIKLAQCASEEMITALADAEKVKRFNGTDNKAMLSYLNAQGKNLYIAGLDNHTGFILHDGRTLYFIHSSGRFPFCVIKQKIEDADVLLESKYKVIGCISESQLLWKY